MKIVGALTISACLMHSASQGSQQAKKLVSLTTPAALHRIQARPQIITAPVRRFFSCEWPTDREVTHIPSWSVKYYKEQTVHSARAGTEIRYEPCTEQEATVRIRRMLTPRGLQSACTVCFHYKKNKDDKWVHDVTRIISPKCLPTHLPWHN